MEISIQTRRQPVISSSNWNVSCRFCPLVPSVASDIIMQMLELTCRKLKQHHAARIKFPTHAEMEDYSQLIQQREPTVTNVIDGLSIPVECSEDVEEQAIINDTINYKFQLYSYTTLHYYI